MPMLLPLVLVALVAQPKAPTPVTRMVVSATEVLVSVQPTDGRKVTDVTLQPTAKPDAPPAEPITMRSCVTLAEWIVRFTFDKPETTFSVVVTLDDGSVHRIKKPRDGELGYSVIAQFRHPEWHPLPTHCKVK